MKYIISLIIAVLFLSGIGNCQVEKEQIDKFENTLGKIETKFLDEIVSDFDLYLSGKYKGESSYTNFKQYLTDISEASNPDIWKIREDRLEKILTSNLFAKYDSIYPDSVGYSNGVFTVSYYQTGISKSITFIRKQNQELNIDSLINSIKKQAKLNEIEPSYFQMALESVRTEDSLIQNYKAAKQTAGTLSVRLIAAGLLHNYTSENEYFAKRILIMEMND